MKQSYREQILQRENKFRNAAGYSAQATELDPNDRTLTFVITNSNTASAKTARLFGASLGLDETYNTANDITVDVQESSHLQVKMDSIAGFRIQGMQITTTTSLQMSNVLKIVEQTSAGHYERWTWQPENYKDPRNFDPKMVKTANFQMSVDSGASIEVELRAGEEIRIVTHLKDKVKTINAIKDKSVVEAANPYKSY